MTEKDAIVELKNIRKVFPGVVALDGVNLTLYPGMVLGLVGENGAGKSTLMKILSGTYASYDGDILIDGNKVHFRSERDALNQGISIVAQELNPIPELSIAENIYLGREPRYGKVFYSYKEMLQNTSLLMKKMELNLNPRSKMRELSVAQKQLVEIVKAISRNSKVLIMDEPTSALTSVETDYLFRQIENLKKQGIAIIFISHKLNEVLQVSDEVMVLRDGKFIGSRKVGEVSQDEIIKMMVGREVKDIYPKPDAAGKETVLQVKNLCETGKFSDISFDLHRGEILGFAGMMGAGRSEVMRSIFGLDHYTSGQIELEGKSVPNRSVRDAIKAGIAMITEDRAAYGFVGTESIRNNIALPNTDLFSSHGWLNYQKINDNAAKICDRLRVRAPSNEALVGTLSGGNQQKVVLCKWLVRNLKVLIMDEPTRGIDVGAKQEIYQFIKELAAAGMAVILISSEMPEVLSMSHRVMVMADGRIVGTAEHGEVNQDDVMKMIIESGKRK